MEAFAFTVTGSDTVQLVSSTTGATFNAARIIGNWTAQPGSTVLAYQGDTSIDPPGGHAGQVAATYAESSLVVGYTSVVDGQDILVTESSGDSGLQWTGPYVTNPSVGSIQNLSLSPSVAGLVYATWDVPSWGVGSPMEAIYFADGGPMLAPTAVPTASGAASGALAGPSLIVDAFQRPVIAWSTANEIWFTGDFLSANATLQLVDQMVDDPLVPADFSSSSPGGGSPAEQAAFNASIASAVSSASGDLAQDKLCNAQNATVFQLYQNLTDLPLELGTAPGSVCSTRLDPNNQTSSLFPTTGVDAPNTYLAVYSDWLLEALAVPVSASPLENATATWGDPTLASPMPGPDSADTQFAPTGHDQGWSNDAGSEAVDVTPSLYTPSTLLLSIFATMPSSSFYQDQTCTVHSLPANFNPNFYANYTVLETWTNLSINNGTVHSFEGAGMYPSPWVTNLTPSASYYWKVTLSPKYQVEASSSSFWCQSGSGPSAPFTATTTTFSGVIKTSLSLSSEMTTLHAAFSSGSNNVAVSTGFEYATNIQSRAWANLTDSGSRVASWKSGLDGLSIYAPAGAGSFNFVGTVGQTYSTALKVVTPTGPWQGSWYRESPGFSYNFLSPNAAAQSASWSFSFTLTRPTVEVWGLQVSNVTATTARVSWISNVQSSGTITYGESGLGNNETISGIAGVALSNHSAWEYTVELHGLQPWTTYVGSFGVNYAGQWAPNEKYTDAVSYSLAAIETLPVLVLSEQDRPYDSVSDTGGGAIFRWTTSSAFARTGALVTGGSLTVWNSSSTITVPISASELNQSSTSPWQNQLNVTLPTLNATYWAVLELNYSTSPAISVSSQNCEFTYELDSSGDGLTNAEKVNGWALTDPENQTSTIVSANPADYSTNGLANDFVEKEYGLNPQTVDSEGSHMLDLWNLTFELGSSSSAAYVPESSAFHLYWENNTTFDPFAYSQFEGDSSPNGTPDNGWSSPLYNITCTGRSNCPGNSPYSSQVLWAYGALEYFLGLPGVYHALYGACPGITGCSPDWLRGVVSTYDGLRLLTVWGKLSWQTNPLVSSTPNDGLADGARLDAAFSEDLGLHVSNLYVTGLSGYSNYSAEFRFYAGAAATGSAEATGYSAPVGGPGNPGRLTNYTTTIPLSQTNQYVTVQVQLLVNKTSSTGPLTAIQFNGAAGYEANVTYDMLRGLPVERTFDNSHQNSSPNGSITVTLSTSLSGGKDPTFLWLPSENGTTNGLPAGLDRYTGEQSFDLLIVNASARLSSVSIPFPGGGSYTMNLSPGLNDLLVPREQFLASPLGQAVFEGSANATPTNLSTPAILGSDPAARSLLTSTFGSGTGLGYELAAYWQNRTIAQGPGTFGSVTELGTANGSSLAITVGVVESPPSNNTGGVVDLPALYSSAGLSNPPALQSIVAVNVSSTATLDLLLAGLLDNTTEGVNGSFESVTSFLPSLGFEPSVSSALANAPIVGMGLYGKPTYQGPPPSNSGSTWNSFVNAVTSIVTNPAGALVSLVGVVWTETVAAYAYLDHLAHEAAAIGAEVVARTAAAVVHVGRQIESALSTLLSFIWTEISSLFTRAIQGLTSAFNSGLRNWMSLVYSAGNHTVLAYEGVDVPANTAAAAKLIGQALVVPLALAIAAGVAIDVLLGITIPFDIGPSTVASFLIPVVIGLLASKLQGAGGSGWPGKMFSFMEGGDESTIMGISSAAEWLFNQTQAMSSSAASDTIAPNFSPPGDAWALSAAIVGGAGTGSGLKIFSLLDGALPAVITPEAPTPQQATAAADAGAAVVYAIIGLSLVLIEYVVSLIAPQSGPLATVAFAAEMSMGIFGTVFAGIATLCALEGERDPAVRTITGALGWVGLGLSLGATGAGLYDVYNLGTHPP